MLQQGGHEIPIQCHSAPRGRPCSAGPAGRGVPLRLHARRARLKCSGSGGWGGGGGSHQPGSEKPRLPESKRAPKRSQLCAELPQPLPSSCFPAALAHAARTGVDGPRAGKLAQSWQAQHGHAARISPSRAPPEGCSDPKHPALGNPPPESITITGCRSSRPEESLPCVPKRNACRDAGLCWGETTFVAVSAGSAMRAGPPQNAKVGKFAPCLPYHCAGQRASPQCSHRAKARELPRAERGQVRGGWRSGSSGGDSPQIPLS